MADVAAEQGVDVQTVIDALVAEASARIDQQVTDGQADRRRGGDEEDRADRADHRMVNTAGGLGGGGMGPAGDLPADGRADRGPSTSGLVAGHHDRR